MLHVCSDCKIDAVLKSIVTGTARNRKTRVYFNTYKGYCEPCTERREMEQQDKLNQLLDSWIPLKPSHLIRQHKQWMTVHYNDEFMGWVFDYPPREPS